MLIVNSRQLSLDASEWNSYSKNTWNNSLDGWYCFCKFRNDYIETIRIFHGPTTHQVRERNAPQNPIRSDAQPATGVSGSDAEIQDQIYFTVKAHIE